jgi:hypothetical protein
VEPDLDFDLEPDRPGWLDAIIARAKLPQLTDLGGAVIVYNNLTCSGVTEHTLRRYPIPYMTVGRERRYKVDDIIAFAREQLKAPIRKPAPRRSKSVVATA